MNERRRSRTLWMAATLVVASLVHMAAIYAIPRVVMARALTRLGALDTMHVGKRPDANARTIVRPSPDILYAACPYDLAQGALKVTAPVAHSTYWSISAFDAATNNYFVQNDQQIAGNAVELIILRRGMAWPAADNALTRAVVLAPSDKGLVLIRTVIDDAAHIPALTTMLHQARCGIVAPAARLR